MNTTPATVQAAQLLLQQLGVSIDDLRRTPAAIPTIAEYLPTVIAASGAGARRTYGSYWSRILTTFGERRLDQIAPSELEGLMRQAMDTPVRRRNTRGGVCAGEHLLAALRAIYTHAVADQLVPAHCNPAARVRKPRRPPSERRALTSPELTAIYDTLASSGNDVALDTILVRFHTETACRRSAAIRLRQEDLDPQWCLVRLREKNHAIRWHPVSPTLMTALVAHREHRGTNTLTAPLLRYRDGTPITTRRHDRLWERIGDQLPWVTAQNIATHWLRHTTITWVERHFSYGIAVDGEPKHVVNAWTGNGVGVVIGAAVLCAPTPLAASTGRLSRSPRCVPTNSAPGLARPLDRMSGHLVLRTGKAQCCGVRLPDDQ